MTTFHDLRRLVKAQRVSEQEIKCKAAKNQAAHLETTLKLTRIINELLSSKQADMSKELNSLTPHESGPSSQVAASSGSNH